MRQPETIIWKRFNLNHKNNVENSHKKYNMENNNCKTFGSNHFKIFRNINF